MEDFENEDSLSLSCSLSKQREKHDRVIVHVDIDCFYAQVIFFQRFSKSYSIILIIFDKSGRNDTHSKFTR